MSSKYKNKFIIIGVILVLIILLVIITLLIPNVKIELLGNANLTLEVGEEYKELGAKATVSKLFKKEKIDVKTEGEVDTSKVGKYSITYEASKDGIIKKRTRVINVVDDIKPEITFLTATKVCKKNNLIEANVKATDNYDGDITDKVEYNIKDDYLYVRVKDSSNNETEIKEKITYADSVVPSIMLLGPQTMYLKLNEKYVEYGAKAKDSCDGDITNNIKIIGEVDVSKAGVYNILYEITDSADNKIDISRKVIVTGENKEENIEPVTAGYIYLTFDDGPGVYTQQFLDVLKKYNVKATFFVTGQFPKYFDLIKKEYEDGHTVGIHTYSHKWDIYDSIDIYLEDFNKIEQVIYEQTGTHPKYFRFPGGTSNTVSRKHCENIMTDLSKLMTEKGYTYFDWTFDSCDTCKNNSKEDILKMVKTYLKGNGDYIILMHDLKKNSLEALPEIIEYAKKRGYVFKKIDENTPLKQFEAAN